MILLDTDHLNVLSYPTSRQAVRMLALRLGETLLSSAGRRARPA
jgi:hypothetical protein